MRVLVIGGTQFIGPPVVRRLVALNHEITVWHRGETEADLPANVAHIHADRAALAEHRAEIERVAPDVVLDMRCMFERDAVALMAALQGVTPRVVLVSSADVYRAYGRMHGSEPGDIEPMPITEDAPLREKLYPYRGERKDSSFDDYDKIPVERACMSDPHIAGTVIRLAAVHGEGDAQHRMFMDVARFDAKRPFIIVPASAERWRWSRCYVGNAAEAIVRCVVQPVAAGHTYHGPVDPPLTQREWTEACGRIAGWSGEVIALPDDRVPAHLRMPLNFAQDLVLDDTRLREELGYRDVFTAEDGMRRAIEWERSKPPPRISERMLDFAAEDAAIQAMRT